MLSRIATPFRWQDLETFFGQNSSLRLCEIFWETVEVFQVWRAPYIASKALQFANAVKDNTYALGNSVAFIDGPLLALPERKKTDYRMLSITGIKERNVSRPSVKRSRRHVLALVWSGGGSEV